MPFLMSLAPKKEKKKEVALLIKNLICGKNEEMDSVDKLSVKFLFTCGSYSQVTTGSHSIFKLIYIVVQNVQHFDNLDGLEIIDLYPTPHPVSSESENQFLMKVHPSERMKQNKDERPLT